MFFFRCVPIYINVEGSEDDDYFSYNILFIIMTLVINLSVGWYVSE